MEHVPPGAKLRLDRKQTQRAERELKRLEKAVEQLSERETELNGQMAHNASDHALLNELQRELEKAVTEREIAEAAWLEASESLEGNAA